MEVIFLCGCVGNPNFGDELIMKMWIEKYSQKSSIIICDGINNRNLLSYMKSISNKNICIMDSDLSVFSMHSYFSMENDLYVVKNKNVFFEKIKTISYFLQSMGVSKIHLFGGGYINTIWKHHLPSLLSLKIISDSIEVPIVATGQGFIPFDMKFKDYLNIIAHFDFVDVRDVSSFVETKKVSANCKVSFSGDDALMVFDDPNNFAISEESSPSFIICLQKDLFPGGNVLSKILSENLISTLISSGIEEIVFIMAMSSDICKKDIPDEILSIINRKNIRIREIDQSKLIKKGIPYNKDSFLITTRYHVHMIGCFSGMRGVALYESGYYKNKHDSVKFTGSLWPIIESSNITPAFICEQTNIALKLEIPYDKNLLENWRQKKREMENKVMSVEYKKRFFVDELNIFRNLL